MINTEYTPPQRIDNIHRKENKEYDTTANNRKLLADVIKASVFKDSYNLKNVLRWHPDSE